MSFSIILYWSAGMLCAYIRHGTFGFLCIRTLVMPVAVGYKVVA